MQDFIKSSFKGITFELIKKNLFHVYQTHNPKQNLHSLQSLQKIIIFSIFQFKC